MVFSSSLFLLYFFPLFLVVYYILPHKARNYWALLASILFYSWGTPVYVFIIFLLIILNYFLAFPINKSQGKQKKIILVIAIVINLLLLLYFKYSDFFIDNLNSILGKPGLSPAPWVKVALPLGISFITFHQISYVIDIYRGEKPPSKNIAEYALYILFFPRLIAGPIIRYTGIADQIHDRRKQEHIDNRLAGFFRFCIGLAKKVLVANVLGAQADLIFNQNTGDLSTPVAWMGILAFAFQIYFDFSGYSDMAIGMARMLGFVFPENFNNPYVSQNITEFWRRWHRTLSGWLRDYLFTPLAVRTRSWKRAGLFFSLLVTFTLCGMWHKPGWNFILWGAFQGLFLIADQLFLLKFTKMIRKIPAIILTFFIILMGWVLFRIENLNDICAFYEKLFSFDTRFCDVSFNTKFWAIFFMAVFFSLFGGFKRIETWQEKVFSPGQRSWKLIMLVSAGMVLFMISVSSITAYGFNPFIYFKF
jgi:alginate O-acetyltransferase complex protein AlgI